MNNAVLVIALASLTLTLTCRELPAASIYVSPSGNDANPGTKAQPVASLERACAEVRRLKMAGPLREAVTIYLRGGTYRRDTPLLLTDADSGTTSCPVIWTACPDEHVILSGGVPVAAWNLVTVNGKAAWSTTLPEVARGAWFFRSLYSADARLPRARLPQTGYFKIASFVDGDGPAKRSWQDGRNRWHYAPGDLAAWPDLANAEAVELTQWVDSHLPLAAVDEATRTVTFGKRTMHNPETGARYYIENVRAGLAASGDWCLSRATGELLYIPRPGDTLPATVLIAPRIPTLVHMDGVANVVFRGITFSHTEWFFPAGFAADWAHANEVWAFAQAASGVPAAVSGQHTSRVALEQCTFAHLGGYAVEFGAASRGNRVAACSFFDLGAGAVKIGPAKLSDGPSEDNVVTDCHICDGCRRFRGAVAIWTGQTKRTQITYNHIHDFDYSGISCGWTWGLKPEESGSAGNLIAWNHIHDVGRGVLGDNGGIYLLGVQPGTVVEYNLVHDVKGTHVSRGIYLDDGGSAMTIRNNLSYGNKTANYFQWKSNNNRVENNIFALGEESQIELGGAVFNGGGPAAVFTHNIILCQPGPLLNQFHWADVRVIYSFDENLYWRPGGQALEAGWRALGWDKNSLEADPRFADAEKRDFRLRPDSPALKMGFKPFDLSKVGPRPETKGN